MKQFLTNLFVVFGVLFVALMLFVAYLYVVDPYEIKPLIFGTNPTTEVKNSPTQTNDDDSNEAPGPVVEGGFTLSEEQKAALVSVGVDPASVPDSISSEQETCFVGVLGEARVVEIKAGAVPSAIEFMKAKSCI